MRCSLIFSKAGHILENHIAHFLQKYYIFAVTAKEWSRCAHTCNEIIGERLWQTQPQNRIT